MLNMGETLWAWVTEMADGSISLVGTVTPIFGNVPMHTPLISRNEQAIRKMEPLARKHADATGQKYWLRKYKLEEEIGR